MKIRWVFWWAAGIAGSVFTLLLSGVPSVSTSESAAAQPESQCVACHTNPAKLQALTPPDPPSEEEGEG
jgi:hypothetical protein